MKLVLLHSSDTHGFLMPTDYQNRDNYDAPISLSRVSSLIKSEKEKYGAENVLVMDSGDPCRQSPLYVSKTFSAPYFSFSDLISELTRLNEIGAS